MSDLRKNIPHIQQDPTSTKCGAVCLKMLYDYYGIDMNLDSIWNEVKWINSRSGTENCAIHKMLKLNRDNGLFSLVLAVADPIQLIRICLKRNIEVMPIYRPEPSALFAHYSIVVDIDDHYVYLNDPLKDASIGAGFRIAIPCFLKLLTPLPGSELGLPNLFLLTGKSDTPLTPCWAWHSSDPSDRHPLELPRFLLNQSITAIPDYNINFVFDSFSRR